MTIQKDSRKKSFIKSLIWRGMGVAVLAAVVYAYTRSLFITGLIAIIHHGTFIIVFYLHERAWFKFKRPVERLRRIVKAFTYEIVLGMGLGGLIVLIITGQWSKVSQITLTYTAIKLVMYYLYEKFWFRKKKSMLT